MVRIYTKTICPKCIAVKGMLEDSGVGYHSINIEHDEEGREKLLDLGYSGLPIVEYEGSYYTNHEEIEQLISQLK